MNDGREYFVEKPEFIHVGDYTASLLVDYQGLQGERGGVAHQHCGGDSEREGSKTQGPPQIVVTYAQHPLPLLPTHCAIARGDSLAMAITVVQLWMEAGQLKAEVERLRKAVGALPIKDPSKPYAVQVRTRDDEFTWKWLVYLPQGSAYALKYVSKNVPRDGIPTAASARSIPIFEAGETLIEYRIAASPQSGVWSDTLNVPDRGVGSETQDWVKWPPHVECRWSRLHNIRV